MTLTVFAGKGPPNRPFRTWWQVTVERTVGADEPTWPVPESRMVLAHKWYEP